MQLYVRQETVNAAVVWHCMWSVSAVLFCGPLVTVYMLTYIAS